MKCLRSGLNAVWPLTEAFALQLIQGKGYGQTRMYCAISWGLCSFFVGYIIDNSPYGIELVFYMTWFVMFLNILILIFLIPSPERQEKVDDRAVVVESNINKNIKNVIDNGGANKNKTTCQKAFFN